MIDWLQYIREYVDQSPDSIKGLATATAATIVRGITAAIKRKWALQGNVVQWTAGGVGVAFAFVSAALTGVFNDGTAPRELGDVAMVGVLIGLGAIAVDQFAFTDTDNAAKKATKARKRAEGR